MAKICFSIILCLLNILFLHVSHANHLESSIHYSIRNEKFLYYGIPLSTNKITVNYYGDTEAISINVEKTSVRENNSISHVRENSSISQETNLLKIKTILSSNRLRHHMIKILMVSNLTSDIENITIEYGKPPAYKYIYILGYFPLNNKARCSKSFQQSYIFSNELYDVYGDYTIDLKCTFKKEANPLIRLRYDMVLRNLLGHDIQILTNIARKETFERHNSTFITYTYSMKVPQYYEKKVHCIIYYEEDTQQMDDIKNYNCYDKTKSCSTKDIIIIEPFSVDINMSESSHIITCSSNMSYVSVSFTNIPIQWKYMNIINETTFIKIFVFDYGTEYYSENISCIGSYKSRNIVNWVTYKKGPETIWEKTIYYMMNVIYYYYDNMKFYNIILIMMYGVLFFYYISRRK